MSDASAAAAGAAAGGIAGAAAAAETVIENVMKVEPMIAGIAGMFVPQVALVQPWILMIAPYLERALKDVSNNNNGDALSGMLELIQHISRGQPNSQVLTASDSSTQGSG
jgi:hypothetical protein